MRRDRFLSSDRGSLLLWALAVNVVILLYVVGSSPFFSSVVATVMRSRLRDQALMLANAGLNRAMWDVDDDQNEINTNLQGHWPPVAFPYAECDGLDQFPADKKVFGLSIDPLVVPSANCKRHQSITALEDKATGIALGTYKVWLVNFNTDRVRLVARGFVPNDTAPLARATVRLDLRVLAFNWALFGGSQLNLKGIVLTDSYNSANGKYDPVLNKSNKGDIKTNGDANAATTDLLVEGGASVDGHAYKTFGDSPSIFGTVTGGVPTNQPDTPQMHVIIPKKVRNQQLKTGTIAGLTGNGNGDYLLPAARSFTCDTELHIRSIHIDGTLNMADGCSLFVDWTTGRQNHLMPPHTGGANKAFEVSATGQILKTTKNQTYIFVRDSGFDIRTPKVSYSAAVSDAGVPANRIPDNNQMYATCAAIPCAKWSTDPLDPAGLLNSTLAVQEFYGAVYVEGGSLDLLRGADGSGNPVNNAIYYGAFASRGKMNVDAGLANTITLHYDEASKTLWSGSPKDKSYVVVSGSWIVEEQ